MAADRPFLHTVIYGPWGSGKSTFAATFPKPMLVLSFDALGKEAPYLKRGIVSPHMLGDFDQPLVQVMSRKNRDKLLAQVEYFHDVEVESDGRYKPTAYTQYLKRQGTLYDEVKAGVWKTVIIDTLTGMELMARKLSQHSLDRSSKEPRRWYAASTEMLEEAIMCRMGGLLCNVVVIAHVDSDKDEVAGLMLGSPAAPGRLRSRIGSQFPEVYFARHQRDKDDKTRLTYSLQTRSDTRYSAASVYLEAPDPCEPTYNALWANYDSANEANSDASEENQS